MRSLLVAAFLVVFSPALAWGSSFGGHLKAQAFVENYEPDDIVTRLGPGQQLDLKSLKFRGNDAWRKGPWDLSVQCQIEGLHGKLLQLENDGRLSALGGGLSGLSHSSDQRQVFDLSWKIDESPTHLVFARLDRLSLGYTRGALSLRAGRQALSWGGGLVYQVLDLFDPFSPNALDTEYKPGIDMLRAQWIFQNGDDLQAVGVPRRTRREDPLELSQSSLGLKWRHFMGSSQLELLAARHYRDSVAGLGLSSNLAGGVWRCDFSSTLQDEEEAVISFLFNYDRTWTIASKNLEGFVEFFRNGFGSPSLGDGLESLPPALLQRLARGEVFNLGRHELALGARYEWSPLTSLEPTVLANLDDGSAYLLFHAQQSLRQNLDLHAGIQIPIGGRGSEYGGVHSELLRSYLGPPETLWIRLARYF
jgi:hypothetical protein